MVNDFDVKRIGDRDFQVKLAKDQVVHFHIKRPHADPETSYFLVEKAAKHFLKKMEDLPKTFRFQWGSKKWKVIKSSPESWFFKLFSYLFPSLVHRGSEKIAYYDIDTSLTAGKKHKTSKETLKFKHLMKDFKAENQKRAHPFGLFSQWHYQKGLRGQMAFQEDMPPYQDPFTALAAWSFQHLEKDFYCRDFKKPEDSSFRLIKNNDLIQLVHKTSPLATQENMQAAATVFLDQCISLYGKERVEYISYHYRLDLENAKELTPEHVYRFNIGTTNTEIQMVEEFQKKIQKMDLSSLPRFTAKRMGENIPELLEKYPLLLKPCDQWDQVTLNECLKWLAPSLSELENAYTGRKIAQMIQSAYTTADLNEFKPWVDQQELTQISTNLINASSWESYLELLSHVVVKKHLCRQHPDDKYRVGALIPAPPAVKGGPVRWYKVTSFSTNRHIHSYTLEGAYQDSKLPAIKIYRSTASSPSALHSSGSLETDFSHINSPGYTGVRMLDDYDKEFFAKRSIPLWVGYHRLAEQKMEKGSLSEKQCIELYGDLCLANQKLVEDEANLHRKKSLRDVIRENDAILNELFLRYSGFKGIKEDHSSAKFLKKYGVPYLRIYKNLVRDYIHPDIATADQIPKEIVNRDAKAFYLLLEKMRHKLPDPPTRDKILIEDLMLDLERHIFSKGTVSNQKAVASFQENVLEGLLDLEVDVNDAFATKDLTSARALMETWSQKLKNYAIERKENLESKIDEDTHVAGQSLGGACGAEGIAHHLIKQGRIPLPNRHVSLFEFDAPGLNDEDNEKFKMLGNENVDLLRSLHSHFDVIRRHETGDFLPLFGEVHLGATYSDEETRKVEKWLRFDATINERLPTSRHPEIAESYAPHITRFLEGRRLRTFFGKDDPVADYLQTHYSPYVQGVFDLRGRLGADNKKERQVHRRIYRHVYKNLWKLPSTFEYFFREELRNSLDFFGWFVRKLTFGKKRLDRHEIPESYLDQRGCFKVSLNSGIETKVEG